jgi:XTP/dITP diphosphohydrolase
MTKDSHELVIATKNAGKIKEIRELLSDLPFSPFSLRNLNDFADVIEPEETGATFTENAVLKAQSYALQTKFWTLADDSGLQVEALGGAPGIFSARYAGEGATDADKIEKLLNEMTKTQNVNRRARFVCAMVVADAASEIQFIAEGICQGRIALAASGVSGFGYDPVFIPDGFSETFGELSSSIKQQISHRARASAKIIQYLCGFYTGSG